MGLADRGWGTMILGIETEVWTGSNETDYKVRRAIVLEKRWGFAVEHSARKRDEIRMFS